MLFPSWLDRPKAPSLEFLLPTTTAVAQVPGDVHGRCPNRPGDQAAEDRAQRREPNVVSGHIPRLRAGALCGTRPDKPLLDEATKAGAVEGNRILQVGHAVAEASVPWIGADGDKHRVPLPSQRPQNSSLPSAELGQLSRPLEVEKASIQLQRKEGGNDKIFGPLWEK